MWYTKGEILKYFYAATMNRTHPICEHSFELNRFNKSKDLVTVVYSLFKDKFARKYMKVSKFQTQNYHMVWNIVHETNGTLFK